MVASFLELLRTRYSGKVLDDKAAEFMEYSIDGAKRIQGMINDLLAYSRVGTRAKSPEPTDSRLCLERAMANLKMAIDEASATVEYDSLPKIRGDETQLTQLFQNLLGNALKFRGERSPEIKIGAEQRDGHWVFSVRDNGIGIDPQYSDRIFKVFQRLHTRDQYPGSGIGLAICKKIVERHGGQIWVDSQLGEGSTFRFTIPL
jgi:light-regulated signal transduction histidine kinase (bacteriophytochrome)